MRAQGRRIYRVNNLLPCVIVGRFNRRRNGHDAGGGVPRAHAMLSRGAISQNSLHVTYCRIVVTILYLTSCCCKRSDCLVPTRNQNVTGFRGVVLATGERSIRSVRCGGSACGDRLPTPKRRRPRAALLTRQPHLNNHHGAAARVRDTRSVSYRAPRVATLSSRAVHDASVLLAQLLACRCCDLLAAPRAGCVCLCSIDQWCLHARGDSSPRGAAEAGDLCRRVAALELNFTAVCPG